MISWSSILSNVAVGLEVLTATCLVFTCFRAKDAMVYAFTAVIALLVCFELSATIAYALHRSTTAINLATDILGGVETIVRLIIFTLLLRSGQKTKLYLVLALCGIIVCIFSKAWFLAGKDTISMYADMTSQLLLLPLLLMFLWRRLNIRYYPDRKQDFWFWVSIAVLFEIVSGVPFSVLLFHYVLAHYSEFSLAQAERISNVKLITGCVFYLLIIRACYEYR